MERTDVLIIGGGIAGASLGARLAGRVSVTIVEAEELCGRHATGRSAALWQGRLRGGTAALWKASLGGPPRERRVSVASKPMFDVNWPGSDTPLLRARGALHLTGPCGEAFEEMGDLSGEFRPVHLDRAEIDRLIPGLREQWTGAWYEASCADIEVAAFHNACLAEVRRRGSGVRTDAVLLSARQRPGGWVVETSSGPIDSRILVNA